MGGIPSREAAAELKVAALSLVPGDIAIHDKFGSGAVVSTTGYGATSEALIDFGAETAVKHLVLCYACSRNGTNQIQGMVMARQLLKG